MTTVREIQVTFDGAQPARVSAFWCAVLGYELAPGAEGETVWKLSAVRKGSYRVRYSIGSTGEVKLETPGGAKPAGAFAATGTLDPRFAYRSWNFRSVIGGLKTNNQPTYPVYPLAPRVLVNDEPMVSVSQ